MPWPANPPTSSALLAWLAAEAREATSLFLRSILETHGESVGTIGRSGWSDGASTRPTGPESPGPEGFASMVAAMVDRGCESAVLELDDTTLDQREVDGLAFESAIVTGLGASMRDGTDRQAMLERRRGFARLARLVAPGGSVVINADEPEADPLGAVNLDARRVTFGIERPAQVSAVVEMVETSGARFRLLGFDREATITLRLAGEEHVKHALAAAALAWSRGIPVGDVVGGLEAVTRLPGRLEPVQEGQDFEVRIDQARTAPDLARALATLRGVVPGRLICVIGAEGGSQRLGRAALARAAETSSDRVILTTDNPRLEDPDQILDDLLAGFRHPGRAFVEPDRRAAIASALAEASPGDAVLIAGKGHHTYQILADRVFPFDDAEIAAMWLRLNRVESRRTSA